MHGPVPHSTLYKLARRGSPRVVVVGGGIGGLVCAAVLARAGVAVTLLEAQSYLGGCAGTFFRKGYRFDAGATVASGFGPEGLMTRLAERLEVEFRGQPADSVMRVHLPGRLTATLPADRECWRERRRELFGPGAASFWRWQEQTAATAWQLADHLPPWPPRGAGDLLRCAGSALRVLARRPRTLAHPGILLDARRPLSVHLPAAGDDPRLRDLRQVVDGLLLISAQATSARALAVYGAAALDFPWRGVFHLRGGMGGMAETFAEALRKHGGELLTRRRVRAIARRDGRVLAVLTDAGERFEADHVVVNSTPWNLRALLDPQDGPLPDALAELRDPERDIDGAWGAFVLHCGVDQRVLDEGAPLHHQVHLGGPMGEANTAFISLSPAWDLERAPPGKRAVTITTHTRLEPWWRLVNRDPQAYAVHKASYQDRLLAAAEAAIPGFRRNLDHVFAGTPVTYQSYTGRARGWVGGVPQTSLRTSFGSALGGGLHLVGDSLFPGQSTLAVASSSLRVASGLLTELGAVEA
ncbi:FAD-dependent oxidoreductase [Pseudenhygromyxa sp. WMMC2535]|uniref:phytoene desaturase family protein n=1 Tax=Pseudenhygromyxa sp. WMMC2535 TaxID=2712867 RepID=UPI0015956A7D|nr:NAD(P)/FAD-dependent oxidoreductase [Pseudenhygromyxa sp. WMMC2535]NVB38693.1 FAD-dependent oxidoreductase [Pseudenhygromyxa sp. WMMC2535]